MPDPLAVQLARMEGKLDASLSRLDSHRDTLDDHGKLLSQHAEALAVLHSASLPDRVAAIERKLWIAAGLAAGLGGGLGGIVGRLLGGS